MSYYRVKADKAKKFYNPLYKAFSNTNGLDILANKLGLDPASLTEYEKLEEEAEFSIIKETDVLRQLLAALTSLCNTEAIVLIEQEQSSKPLNECKQHYPYIKNWKKAEQVAKSYA